MHVYLANLRIVQRLMQIALMIKYANWTYSQIRLNVHTVQ